MKRMPVFLLVFVAILMAACVPHTIKVLQPGIVQIGPKGLALQNPIWSPDGKLIAATRITNGQSWTSEIYIIDLSTDNITRSVEKTDYGNLDAQAWSPDGNLIAFTSQRGGDWPEGIWIANVNGVNSKQLMADGYNVAWSPDGSSLAIFSTSLGNGNETRVLNILDLKTSSETMVFSGIAKYTTANGLVWSPDGKNLMFSFGKQDKEVSPMFTNVDIYLLNIVTGNIKKLTNEAVNHSPTWSPNGNLFAYIRNTAGDLDLKLMISNKDGSCTQQVVPHAWSADWSPDGMHIAFDYAGGIYILNISEVLGKDFLEHGPSCSQSQP